MYTFGPLIQAPNDSTPVTVYYSTFVEGGLGCEETRHDVSAFLHKSTLYVSDTETAWDIYEYQRSCSTIRVEPCRGGC